jgi:hypothetical protein
LAASKSGLDLEAFRGADFGQRGRLRVGAHQPDQPGHHQKDPATPSTVRALPHFPAVGFSVHWRVPGTMDRAPAGGT